MVTAIIYLGIIRGLQVLAGNGSAPTNADGLQ